MRLCTDGRADSSGYVPDTFKAGYHIQIGVESEYIVGVGAFSNRTDVQTLVPFLNRIKMHTQRKVEQVIADAGYESQENYL